MSLDNVNLNLFTRLVFLDLQKAFDTLSHNILLIKLKHYQICCSTNLLIKSFLIQKQDTFINGYKSKVEPITNRVVQGSPLEPLLFLLFINNLPNPTSCLSRFFVNDT